MLGVRISAPKHPRSEKPVRTVNGWICSGRRILTKVISHYDKEVRPLCVGVSGRHFEGMTM